MIDVPIPPALRAALEAIVRRGGRPLLAGGCVRDACLGAAPADYDVEVFGMGPDELRFALAACGRARYEGKSFGVFLLDGAGGPFQFSLPSSPDASIAVAARRRDFTINAMYHDPLSGATYDPCGGFRDLQGRVLRPAGPAFGDDPLRMLRGMQLAGRFRFEAEQAMAPLGVGLLDRYDALPRERVWGEWWKWATLAPHPAYGLAFLFFTGWLNAFPHLKEMLHCQQDPKWHPEGSVFHHTMFTCDAAAGIARRDGLTGDDRAVLLLAALLHDVGKPLTTVVGDDGRWRSPGHAEAGVPVARDFLIGIGCPARIRERVLPLVAEHMIPVWDGVTRRLVRRLKVRLGAGTVPELLRVMEADHSGRPPLPGGLPAGAMDLTKLAGAMPRSEVEPILKGRHLLERGFVPSPSVGRILRGAFDAQLDGDFADLDGAVAWLHANYPGSRLLEAAVA